MSKTKLIKRLSAAVIAAGLTVIPAWTALAVTNPADNPHPITVTGDDGNTYHDGADTLPGYDDEECTYIPGAWFDFAANRVRYADGQSIPWTEWDRASGYQQWLASQNNSSNPTPTPTPTDSSGVTTTGKKSSKKSSGLATTDATATDSTEVVTLSAEGTLAGDSTGSNPLSVAVGQETSSNPGREVGLSILGFLFGAGVVITVVHALRSRLSGGNH